MDTESRAIRAAYSPDRVSGASNKYGTTQRKRQTMTKSPKNKDPTSEEISISTNRDAEEYDSSDSGVRKTQGYVF